ncbi:MAG: DUF1232 domain-containing protein [Chloroflexi bacterium]|nr:DUF1232 domain-containing protein [Chloroflexota bacterium]
MAKQPRKTDPDLLARLWQDMVLSVRLLMDRRVGGTAKLIPAIVLLYLLSPVDLIPEAFLPLGILDDFGVFLLGMRAFILSTPADIRREYQEGRTPDREKSRRAPDEDTANRPLEGPQQNEPHVIEGSFRVRERDEE